MEEKKNDKKSVEENNIEELSQEDRQRAILASYWVEKVVIITDNYEIIGSIYMPKTTKRTRLLSELLNSNRKFIAVKECTLQSRVLGAVEPEVLDFLEINVNSIIMLKPYNS